MKRMALLLTLAPLALCAHVILTFQTLIELEDLEGQPTEVVQALKKWNGKEVEIRGFIYQTDQGKWVVSCDPNVPSCCRNKENLCRKIFLHGDMSGADKLHLAHVWGTFRVHPIKGENDQLEELLHIEHPKLKSVEGFKVSYILAAVGGLGLIAVVLRRRWRNF